MNQTTKAYQASSPTSTEAHSTCSTDVSLQGIPKGCYLGTYRDRRPRKPTQQEMDIFEQQDMSKGRPQVKSKLNKWYYWLINHVPKPIKDGVSKAFKTFKDKIMGLYYYTGYWFCR